MSHSSILIQQAKRVIPGGVNSPVRAYRAVGGEPPFIARAEGSRLVDVDGHVYIDLVSSWGAIILGHASPHVVAAASQAVRDGSTFGAPTEAEVRLAEAIISRVPGIDKVRLCSSGTEATMHALRVARGVTKRDLIVKMDGCYHGAHDAVLVSAGSGVATLGIPDTPGVPVGVAANTRVVPYNDLEVVSDLFKAEGDKIAAVILEPVAGNMGTILPLPGYLEGLRALCTKYGVLLVFDEVMTGFRVARGGAIERFGVQPDLVCYGKVVGGGFPLAAFAGRDDIMRHVAPEGPIYQAGTLSGNPVAVAAGLEVLKSLDDAAYHALERAGADLEDDLSRAAAYHGCSVARIGSMLTLFFRPTTPKNFSEAKDTDIAAFSRFFHGALDRGVYLPPSAFEACFLMVAHDDEGVMRSAAAALQEAIVEASE